MTDEKVEPRKASDILLALETKVEQLLQLSRSQDLNIKIISNKLNGLIEEINSMSEEPEQSQPIMAPVPVSQFVAEPFDSKNNFQLPLESSPNGTRRTARPETYNNVPVTKETSQSRQEQPELLYNPKRQNKSVPPPPQANKPQIQGAANPAQQVGVSKSPVTQRVVDANKKAVFLAGIEIVNVNTNVVEFSGRTNGSGKWQASLPPGVYKVTASKQESISKAKLSASTEFSVSAAGVLLELPDLIGK